MYGVLEISLCFHLKTRIMSLTQRGQEGRGSFIFLKIKLKDNLSFLLLCHLATEMIHKI